MTLNKTYQPDQVEKKWYQQWQDKGYFHSKPDNREPYTIVIPPPNVTGVLHMGHMLNNTIQDVLIRRARMLNKNACWVPGTDHASIATEAKVVKLLSEQGMSKQEAGRKLFLEKAWEWKEKYGGIILEQLKRLGCSCDWERTRFTMEPSLSDAVNDIFIELYNKGFIYRGERMVNWDPKGKTAISDEEVIHKDVQSKLYYINYPIEGSGDDYVTIATTRPETILADTAICINPEDERYKHLHGKKALVPFVNRPIPIILDEYVSMEFGTGCLKVTPAHDPNDYELGKKHSLPTIDMFNEDGTVHKRVQKYIGEDRFVVRKKIAVDLEAEGYLNKVEDYKNQVGFSERTDAVIEPRISMQWFVDMKKFMETYPQVLDDVMNDEIQFHPPKFKNTYRHWMENIKDWCISRQLWWGHRIPAYYLPNGEYIIAASKEEAYAEAKSKAGNENLTIDDLQQDEDVLDTWFSSWLWPISVFDGFDKDKQEDIKYYYPTSDLITGPDIIFFWVARMIMAGYAFQGKKPFSNVYFTGLVRDNKRRKMSKSLGNSPDPEELMDKFGTDAVRMGLLLSAPAGNDILFDESLLGQGRNFCNKIWNAFRLIQGWEIVPDTEVDDQIIKANQQSNDWFAYRFNEALAEVEQKMADYRLSEALMSIYKLIWDDFCSLYLEMIKPAYGSPINQSTYDAAIAHSNKAMRMLHPYMPFITEELWQVVRQEEGAEHIIIAEWPKAYTMDHIPAGQLTYTDRALDLVSQIRNVRSSKGLSPKELLEVSIKPFDKVGETEYAALSYLVSKLGNVDALRFVEQNPFENSATCLVDKDEAYIKLNIEVNAAEERDKINQELNRLQGFLKSVNAKLSNERFVANAAAEVVERERQKKKDAEAKINALEKNLLALK